MADSIGVVGWVERDGEDGARELRAATVEREPRFRKPTDAEPCEDIVRVRIDGVAFAFVLTPADRDWLLARRGR